jgi:hypothetical protein
VTRVSSGFFQEMQQYPTEIDGRGLADVATHLVRARRGRDSWIADPAYGSFTRNGHTTSWCGESGEALTVRWMLRPAGWRSSLRLASTYVPQ